MNKLASAVVGGVLFLGASLASASVIESGSVSFSSLSEATYSADYDEASFDFDVNGDGFNAVVTTSTDDFASFLTAGDLGTFFDFEYDTDFVANSVIWTAGGLTFTLFGIDSTSFLMAGTNIVGVSIYGLGEVTDGVNTSLVNADLLFSTQGTSTFSWSSTTNAVPEPASIALLGLGLVGLGFARSRKAS